MAPESSMTIKRMFSLCLWLAFSFPFFLPFTHSCFYLFLLSALGVDSEALHVLGKFIPLSCISSTYPFLSLINKKLRQYLIKLFKLAFNSLCSQGWPRNATDSECLGLKAPIIRTGFNLNKYINCVYEWGSFNSCEEMPWKFYTEENDRRTK